jgi:hypothetical protein
LRRSLLDYVKSKDVKRYEAIISSWACAAEFAGKTELARLTNRCQAVLCFAGDELPQELVP